MKDKYYQNVLIFAHEGIIACAKTCAGLTTFDKAFNTTPTYGQIVCIDF